MQVSEQAISLVIFEDDDNFLSAVVGALEGTGIEVIGVFPTPGACLQFITEARPQVALIDLYYLRRLVGVELIRRIVAASPDTKCIVLTGMDPKGTLLADAYRAGAVGYQRKGYIAAANLPELIARTAEGQYAFDSMLAKAIIDRFEAESAFQTVPTLALTDREREVLRLVAAGLETKEIAESLVISATTVNSHITHVLNKFQMKDRHRAAVYWVMKESTSVPRRRSQE